MGERMNAAAHNLTESTQSARHGPTHECYAAHGNHEPMNTTHRYQNILTLALGLSLFAATETMAQNAAPDVLLERAMQREMVDGDLSGAIELYKTVVSARGVNRAVAAKGLYQMGLAYEKLGNAEARKAYERIGREFADQKEVAAEAGRRLAAMRTAETVDNDQPRRVASPNADSTISFDDRWMTATIWEGPTDGDNQLVVQDTVTGQVRRLLRGSCGKPCTFSDSAILSPDTKQVAFAWYDDAEFKGQAQLRVIANESGAAPRILLRNIEFNVYPHSWSLDSKSILVSLRNRNRSWQLGWVSVADGALKVIKSYEWRLLTSGANVALSPDGRFIAVAALATNPSQATPSASDSTDTHIYLLAADGRSEVALVKAAGINKSPLWTPDGSQIVFTSNLSGKVDLWAVSVTDGNGSLKLLKRDIGEIEAVALTMPGTYYYRPTPSSSNRSVERVYVAELNAGGRARESFVGINPSWSPDGKSIAFLRISPQAENQRHIVVRSIETGQEATFSRNSFVGPRARWLHDGWGFVTNVGPVTDSWLQTVDLRTNSVKRTIRRSPFWAHVAAISPDDQTMYTIARDPSDDSDINNRASLVWDRIVAVNLATGEETIVLRLPGTRDTLPRTSGLSIALSPDGRSLAYAITNPKTSETALFRVDTDGGNPRQLCGPYKVSFPVDRLAWPSDGRSIVFAMSAGGRDTKIMKVDSNGGTPEFTGVTISDLFTFDLSPDGSKIVYSTNARPLDSKRGLYAIDNLPALLKAAK